MTDLWSKATDARKTRTPDAVLTLLAAYADSGCGTYAPDTLLIDEVFPEGPPGFILEPCAGWAGIGIDYTVRRSQ